MFKGLLVLLSIYALVSIGSSTTTPPVYAYNKTLSYYMYPFTNSFQIQDNLFILNDTIMQYNTTSNQSLGVPLGFMTNCTDLTTYFFFTLTSNGNFYCANFGNNSLNQVNPLTNFSIENSWKLNAQLDGTITDYNDYLVMAPSSGKAFSVFDTLTNAYVCNNAELPTDFSDVQGYAANGTSLVYAYYNSDNDLFNFTSFNCSAPANEATKNISATFNLDLSDFSHSQMIILNTSTIFVSFVQNSNNTNTILVGSFSGNYIGNTTFAQANGDTLANYFLKVNDTYFVMAYSQNNYDYLGAFVINSTYGIVQTAAVNLFTSTSNGMTVSNVAFLTGQNSSTIVLGLSTYTSVDEYKQTAAYLTVSLQNFTILQAAPYWIYNYQPGVMLGNGTWVEFGFQGQWLNTNGTITFNFMPAYAWTVYATNGDIMWGMYTNAYQDLELSDACMFFQLQLSTSTFTQYDISDSNCDCDMLVSVYDFWVDSVFINNTTNTINATYRCSTNTYQVLLNNASYAYYSDNAVSPIILANWENQTINIFDSYGTSSMELNVWNFTTGDQISKGPILTLPEGANYYQWKLNDSVLTFVGSINTTTTIAVYDLLTQSFLFQQNVTETNMTNIVPFGINNYVSGNPVQAFFLANATSAAIYNTFGVAGAQPSTQFPNYFAYWPYALGNNTCAMWYMSDPIGFINYYQLTSPGSSTTSSASFSANISSSMLWIVMMIVTIISIL